MHGQDNKTSRGGKTFSEKIIWKEKQIPEGPKYWAPSITTHVSSFQSMNHMSGRESTQKPLQIRYLPRCRQDWI